MIEIAYFQTLERELEISSDSPEISDFFRMVFGRSQIDGPTGSLPCDRARLFFAAGDWSVEFNGRTLDLSAEFPTVPSLYRFAFGASHRVFRESFAENANYLNFYGAAIERVGRAIVIVAAPRAGKTMLALKLVERGAGMYSDEFVFVRRSDRQVSGLLANPFVREPAVAPLGIDRLSALCAEHPGRQTSLGFRTWYEFAPESIFARDVAGVPAPLAAIVVLDPAAPLDRPTRMPTALAAVELARRLNGRLVGFSRVAEVAELVAGIPAYRMCIGDLPKAVDALLDELR